MINDRIFAIMVVMCLVTTFMTSPLIAFVYPVHHQVSVAEALRKKTAKAMAKKSDAGTEQWADENLNILACVDRMEQVPSIVSLVSKFQVSPHVAVTTGVIPTPLYFNVLRLMETSDRSSSVFYASSSANISPAQNDHVLQVMTLINRLLKIRAKCFYAVAPVDAYGEEVDRVADSEQCNMLVMTIETDGGNYMAESIMKGQRSGITPVLYVDRKRVFETQVVAYSALSTDQGSAGTAVVADVASSSSPDASTAPLKILMPFGGGRLDRKALKLALRLSLYPGAHVTVLYITVVNTKSQGTDANNGTAEGGKRQGAIAFISHKIQESSSKVSEKHVRIV